MIYEKVDVRTLVLSDSELSARLKSPIGVLPDVFHECLVALKAACEPSFAAVRVSVSHISESELFIGAARVRSEALSRVLSNCTEAVLLCATLGFGAERLLRRYSTGSPAMHFMTDAAADALVEALCDAAEERVLSGISHTARFSPGYADLPLSFVSEIVRATDAGKLLGVTLNESFLAVPTKTVTAIIGIKD